VLQCGPVWQRQHYDSYTNAHNKKQKQESNIRVCVYPIFSGFMDFKGAMSQFPTKFGLGCQCPMLFDVIMILYFQQCIQTFNLWTMGETSAAAGQPLTGKNKTERKRCIDQSSQTLKWDLQMRKGHKNNNKISMWTECLSSSSIPLIISICVSKFRNSLSYFAVIQLLNYSPFFTCNGLKYCLLTTPPTPILILKSVRVFHFLKNEITMYTTTLQL
jgi:hypothetical protein